MLRRPAGVVAGAASWAATRFPSRYETCGRPGCGVPFDACHIHHIRPWVDTQTTKLTDLIPVCTADHHMLHEGGWRLDRDDDWTDLWTGPTGQTLVHRPRRE